jgi:pimeloyl-ACP methyl ester carboxylesterase
MSKLKIILFILYVIQPSYAQNLKVVNNEAIHFTVQHKKDVIDFILLDTKLDAVKPVFLFCQGSLPIPLFVQPDKEPLWMIGGGVTNFDLNEIKNHYHLVVISMPNTPVIVGETNLNKAYCYIPNPLEQDEFDKDYIAADYVENYESRAQHVLKYLLKQKWVSNSKLIVAGHSQGSKVATLIALNNKKVTHLGLFAANPFGRIDQNIRYYRKKAEQHQLSWEEADERIEAQYELLKNAYDAKKVSTNPELKAWKSFSKPILNNWLKIEIPTYLAYGTNDIASDLCDLVPLFYIQNSKTNLTYRRYLNLEHNFFEVDEKGVVDYEKDHWKEVMNGFILWTLK